MVLFFSIVRITCSGNLDNSDAMHPFPNIETPRRNSLYVLISLAAHVLFCSYLLRERHHVWRLISGGGYFREARKRCFIVSRVIRALLCLHDQLRRVCSGPVQTGPHDARDLKEEKPPTTHLQCSWGKAGWSRFCYLGAVTRVT